MSVSARLVFLDGILVPVESVRMAWTADGRATASISLTPSRAAESIMPSTHVHIFHVESGLASMRRRVASIGSDFADRASLFKEESSSTLGEVFFPRASEEGLSAGRGNLLMRSHPFSAIHYRFGGEIISQETPESAEGGANVTYTCAGYDHLMDGLQAIQLVRGAGTLAEEERRFFGQSSPVFSGSGRNAFFDGMAELLADNEYGLGETCRRLATVYPARLNTWAAHRFAWARLADQLSAIDGDATAARLMDTNAFKRFLKEELQSNYILSLRAAITTLMSFFDHRMVALPTPAYFPLVHTPSPATASSAASSTEQVGRAYLLADVALPARRYPRFPERWDDPESPLYGGRLVVSGHGADVAYGWEATGTSVPLEVETRPATRVRGSVSSDGFTLSFRADEDAAGGPATYEVDLRSVIAAVEANTPDPISGRLTDPVRDGFEAGKTYVVTLNDKSVSAPGILLGAFDVRVAVSERRRRVRLVTQDVNETPPPPPPDEVRDGRRARLSAYGIVPHLWWACPPACNVIVPEEVVSAGRGDPGMYLITRLLGKVSPGRSGSGSVFTDKFVAPNAGELNQGAANTEDEPRDPEQLWRPEWISGPRPDIYYFEKLHRFVRDEAAEPYLRQVLSMDFWNRRLGPRKTVLQVRTSIRPVAGFPLLYIRSAGDSPVESAQTDEQRGWVARIHALEDLARSLRRARASLGGNAAFAESLRQKIRGMYAIRAFLETAPSAGRSLSAIEEGRLGLPYAGQGIVGDLSASGVDPGHAVLGGSTEAYFGEPVSTTRGDEIRRLITSSPEEAVDALTAMYPNPYPQLRQLERWHDEVQQNVYDPSPCRAALQADIERVEAALVEAREALRSAGGVSSRSGQVAYVGYVESVEESTTTDASAMTVVLSHVRKLGEDLDWDGLPGDDPEALIAFGEQGYADPRYRTDRIGEEVYLPLLGCGSIADTDYARGRAELPQEAPAPSATGLPPTDASDVVALLTHPSVCGRSYANADSPTVGNGVSSSVEACLAVVEEYRRLKAAGADAHSVFDWLEALRARATCTLADAYREMPVAMDADPAYASSPDVSKDDDSLYPEGRGLPGFWRGSFLADDMDYERVGVVSINGQGERTDVPLTEDEKDLLRDRVGRIRDYLDSIQDGTFTRT